LFLVKCLSSGISAKSKKNTEATPFTKNSKDLGNMDFDLFYVGFYFFLMGFELCPIFHVTTSKEI
jgi:hypothetical protein